MSVSLPGRLSCTDLHMRERGLRSPGDDDTGSDHPCTDHHDHDDHINIDDFNHNKHDDQYNDHQYDPGALRGGMHWRELLRSQPGRSLGRKRVHLCWHGGSVLLRKLGGRRWSGLRSVPYLSW